MVSLSSRSSKKVENAGGWNVRGRPKRATEQVVSKLAGFKTEERKSSNRLYSGLWGNTYRMDESGHFSNTTNMNSHDVTT